MEWIFLVKKHVKYFTMNGLGISLLLGYLWAVYSRNHQQTYINKYLNVLSFGAFLFAILIAFSYLIYPNYYDHVESTVAMLGLMVKGGTQLYPSLDAYTLHGLLYGPFLTEIQSVIQSLPFDPILNSKIPGVLAFLLFSILAFGALKNPLSRGYLVLLLMFGPYVFWTRAEPVFLLICIFSWIVCLRGNSWRWFLLGLLAGLATSLKLHGFLYVFPFACISWIQQPLDRKGYWRSLAFLTLGGAFTFTLSFWPDNISVKNYLIYLRLASGHEIDYELAEQNLIYSILMQIPVFAMLSWRNEGFARKFLYLLIIFTVLLASIVGAKVGSGLHHLMPFVVVNACLIEVLAPRRGSKGSAVYLSYAFILLSVYFLILDAPKIIRNSIANNAVLIQLEIRKELDLFSSRYPQMLMGVSEDVLGTYSYTFYRVVLQAKNSQQIDPAAYMDLQYARVTDAPLVKIFESCSRPIVIVPNKGRPFSLLNFYTAKPLFSDLLRETFFRNYHLVDEGQFFNVYQCVQ